jgi:lipopolysaccharide/colanic/teichoic acid biosynthesis glycosyltransferase
MGACMSVDREISSTRILDSRIAPKPTPDAPVPTGESPPGQGTKHAFDAVAAAILLVLTAPLVVLAALAVKLTSRGPVIYRQTRTGKDGKPYSIFKIRTMAHNCESATGARWALPSDPRITWVGRFLRNTHLDELPQLWNILRGEMSLVGPRPERPEFVVRLRQVFPDYCGRLTVRPGVTGLAQIQLPADTDLASVGRKLAFDLYYVNRRTLWLDLRIILGTAFTVLSIPFSVPRLILQLPDGNAVAGVRQIAEESDEFDALVARPLTSVG